MDNKAALLALNLLFALAFLKIKKKIKMLKIFLIH